jgi:membrane protein
LKGLLVVQLARAAERVARRRSDAPEAGRLGGEVAAASVAVPVTHTRPARLREEEALPPEAEATPKPALRNAGTIAKFVFKEFGKDNGTLMAAAVAFYILLSLVPLVLVAVSIIGYVLGSSNEAANKVLLFLDQFVPIEKEQIHGLIKGLVKSKGQLAGVGLAGVALAATGGFATLENAINVLWNRPNRNFIVNKIFAFVMMLVVGALLIGTLGATAALSWAGGLPGMAWLEHNWTARTIGYLLPIAISGVMFAFIYRFYPNGGAGWRTSLISGFITAVLWEAFKNGYAYYATNFADQSATYGEGLGAAVGLVLWVYYSSVLVLLGSELTWVLEGAPGREGKEQVHEQRARAG